VPGAVAGAVLMGFVEAATGAIPFLGQRYVLFVQLAFIVTVHVRDRLRKGRSARFRPEGHSRLEARN